MFPDARCCVSPPGPFPPQGRATFDSKPRLTKDDGKPIGESGIPVSELFPK